MKKEVAKLKLNKAQSNLKMAEIVLEMHENGVRELREDIENLKAIINKKDDWRDKLVQPNSSAYFYIGYGLEGVTTYTDINTDRKPEYAFRKPSHAQLLADKIQLMQEIHAFAHARNEGWVPDWEDGEQTKYSIVSRGDGIKVDWVAYNNSFVFGVVVKSIEIAGEMLEEFGERIEKFYNKQY